MGHSKKQSIQWEDQSKPLYSSYGDKHLIENRNLDICVTDWAAGALVVVSSAAGKLRFNLTGPSSTPKEPFHPHGITTDSQGNILMSEFYNHRIQIIDQDGHFLRFIHKCGLQYPLGLCVDFRNNLFVAENDTLSGKVKKLQYHE
uniref:Tripartite motif-containing protein 3-like n=1 Tax=Crassostrea virginica TaxID=6565 RepID=A0A8B8DXT2_CRAVI|nr:tripartite motif-containing protein 3-like [Crassostrea virginica]